MGLFEAAVLGLVQGLTEFLPISSTAHLRVVPELLGWQDPGAAFSAVIQLGTVFAVVIYFWKDVLTLGGAWVRSLFPWRPMATPESRMAWYVILGTIPVCVLGLLLKPLIESQFRSLYVVAGSLMVLAVILEIAERKARHERGIQDITLKDGWTVGCWQALALIPGSSRSGTTLTGGLFLGLTREAAARFSFLLSIPATGLAGLFELKHLLEAQDRPSNAVLMVGTLTAFVSGMAAIAGLLRYLRTRTTQVFVVYRLALGLFLLGLLWAGKLAPTSGKQAWTPPAKCHTLPAAS